ncbi:MAG TPA: DNA primase [Methylomirabilota bacterium]|nr:DNA primase [Methylomirabilota bacterium]
MPGFTPALLEEIRSRVDIVELVGQWVKLKRAGENWKGLCPFHTEKTPSFTVNPKKGIYHCFGCKAGGDAFSFLRKQERLDFPEAVRALAERSGVEIPTERAERAPDGRLEGLRAVMTRAAQFFADSLWAPGDPGADKARRYLAGRGVDDAVARRFGLGYAPEGWDNLLTSMRRNGIGEEVLSQAGLVLPRQNATGFYDRFRGRLMFSIRDPQGRVVAFGGRALGPDEVKYINSPETPLYTKGQTLYALDLAKPSIRERNRAVVVEGYLDCLMAHQHGFTETVAALGTAFTAAQLGLLRRNAEEIVAVFDADAAGQKASARLEEMMSDTMDMQGLAWTVSRTGGFERSGYFPVKVAVLPPGHDPDSLLRAEGAPAFLSRLEAARSILSFVMQQALSEEDLSTARGRAAAHARVALILSKVPNAEEATTLAAQAARELRVDATQLWIEAQQLQRARLTQSRFARPGAEPAAAETTWAAPGLVERDLMLLLLRVDEARAMLLPLMEDGDVAHLGLRALLAALRRVPQAPAEELMHELEGDAEKGLLASLLVEERELPDVEQQIRDFTRRFETRQRKRELRRATQSLAEADAAGAIGIDDQYKSVHQAAEAVRELTAPRAASDPGATARP